MSDEGKGLPIHCRCGERVRLRTSNTKTNPGRLFHACPVGEEGNHYHLFKWTDQSMIEEIEDMKPQLEELRRASLTLEKASEDAESEIETLTMETRTCEAMVGSLKKEIRGFEKELHVCQQQLRGLKNLIAVIVVTVIFYNFVM